MARLLKTDGTIVRVKPANSKTFTLEEMQKFVGGYIELVRTTTGHQMFINEEGKLQDLPLNVNATRLLHANYGGDRIVGDALIVDHGEVK